MGYIDHFIVITDLFLFIARHYFIMDMIQSLYLQAVSYNMLF